MAVTDDILVWKNRLLDLSKRNNLINYKDSKTSTLEILKPDFFDAFKLVSNSKRALIYDIKNEIDEEVDDDLIDKNDKTFFLNKYSKKVTANELLLFNAYTPIKKVLRMLSRKATESITERGVNILYCAFGLVRWKESDEGKIYYESPLLLIPVRLTNEASNKPFYIEQYDDDITINQAFKYMLKTEYGINLPDYNDEGLEEYLDKVKPLIPNFELKYEARLSTFSFNKLNMYLDIENNETKISLNKNVMLLSNSKKDARFYESLNEDINNFSKDLFIKQNNVVNADFSQTEAINYALKGKSFVLQGPPGTGKSQTITNIIAELMYAGKKVLFVSEKMAALEIVYNNLKKVGLSEFLLELHSYKANKKEFVKELYDTLLTDKTIVNTKSDAIYNDLNYSVDKLNKYEEALYKIYKPINKSLYTLLGLYNHYKDAKEIKYIINDIKKYDEEKLKHNVSLLEKYVSFEKMMGYDYKKHPLYGFTSDDLSYEFEIKIKELLSKAILNNKNVIYYFKKIGELYSVKITKASSLNSLITFSEFIIKSKIKDPKLLNIKVIDELLNEIDNLKVLSEKIIDNLYKTNDIFKSSILDEDIKELYDQYFMLGSTHFKRRFSSSFKVVKSRIESFLVKPKNIGYTEMCKLLLSLIDLKKDIEEFNKNKIQNYNLNLYKSYNTNWDNLSSILLSLKEALKKNPEFKSFNLNSKIDSNLLSKAKTSLSNFEIYNKNLKGYYAKECDITKLNLSDRLDLLTNTFDNLSNLSAWIDYSKLINKLEEDNLLDFVNKYLATNNKLRGLVNSYYKCFYRQLLDSILKSDDVAKGYTRLYHDADINTFINKDEEALNLARYKIKEKLSHDRPDPNLQMSGSPVNLIKREYNKTRKLMPIRTIFDTIPDFIQKIKPCFLMSPLSVSTYLGDKIKFDVVIFDEASQVFPEDALVAIYRSKQLIVVGDSKQMPPTSFFMNSDYDEEYDEESDADSFESILDLAISVLPTKSLLCHYRSKDESLITFSNKNFYDYRLLSYPSSLTGRKDFGVDFIYVVKGVMDEKKKVNELEALKVVDLIFEHFKKYPDRSLGVVAFNIRQQEEIARLCQIRRDKDPSFEKYFSREAKEPFFIKNLETVQGDERDTIIFSVTYAKNAKGVFNHRFGPLNALGGERRLNVAITRAKLNVKVVSSIRASDIDISKVTNEGPKLLQSYLAYAERGVEALGKKDDVMIEETDSPFERDVYNFLKENGFDLDIKVGSSKYRIDLALKQNITGDYVLAIECDGATYHNQASARDRDRLRQRVLEGMNWRFYRIWSIDWFKNNEIEKKELLVACHKALADARERLLINSKKGILDIDSYVTLESSRGSANIYDTYERFELVSTSFKTMSTDIDEIVKVEAPVSINYLLKKYAKSWYKEAKVTKEVKESFDKDYHQGFEIRRNNEFLYIDDSDLLSMRKDIGAILGDIEYVSLYELRNGLYQAIEYNGKCKKEDLFTFMREELGFARTGDKINKRLDKAFKLLEEYITIDKEEYINLKPTKKLDIIRRIR